MARHLKVPMLLESSSNRAPREMTVEYRTRLMRYFNFFETDRSVLPLRFLLLL